MFHTYFIWGCKSLLPFELYFLACLKGISIKCYLKVMGETKCNVMEIEQKKKVNRRPRKIYTTDQKKNHGEKVKKN